MGDRRYSPGRWIGRPSPATVGRLAVSVVLFAILLTQIDLQSVVRRILDLPPLVVLGAISLSVANVCLSVWKWQILLRGVGYYRSYRVLWVYYYIGQFFNFFFPSSIGGDTVRAYYLYDDLGAGYDAVSSIAVERLTGLVAIVVVALPATLLAAETVQSPVIWIVLPVGALTLLVVGTYLTGHLDWVVDRTATAVSVFDIGTRIAQAYDAVVKYRSVPRTLVGSLAISILFRLVLVTNTYFVAVGLGMDLTPAYFLLFVPIVEVLLFLPISIQGFGVRELAYPFLFGAVGASVGSAAALGLVMTIVLSIVNNVLGGAVYVLTRLWPRTD
jgi:uncharacterized protein (TIRG00374 family)